MITLVSQQKKLKAKVRFSNKSFDEFLQHTKQNSFFLRPTSLDQITNLILSLNESKSVGPDGIPTKILKLLKNDISLQLINIFNLSFYLFIKKNQNAQTICQYHYYLILIKSWKS